MHNSMIWRVIVLTLLLLSASPVLPGSADNDRAREAKAIFIAVETVSRMGRDEQKQHIRQLYQEAFARFDSLRASLRAPGPAMPAERLKLSPEQLADNILGQANGGWPWLAEEARRTCSRVLAENRESLVPLIKADLQSKNTPETERALQVISDLRMGEFFDAVLRIFESDLKLSGRAAYTLRDIRDPRAIAPMVKKYPDLATGMIFEILRSLQTGTKADPSLLRRLDSEDPEVRWRAAYALAESGDPNLIPYVERLAKDTDARMREQASNIGFCMKGAAFRDIRPVLVSLLFDSSVKVRLFTACCFAWRKDAVCARTLLELVQDSSMEEAQHSNVVQAIENLTGSYFGYYFGSDAWRPTTENNREAIKRFGTWVTENAANQQVDATR